MAQSLQCWSWEGKAESWDGAHCRAISPALSPLPLCLAGKWHGLDLSVSVVSDVSALSLSSSTALSTLTGFFLSILQGLENGGRKAKWAPKMCFIWPAQCLDQILNLCIFWQSTYYCHMVAILYISLFRWRHLSLWPPYSVYFLYFLVLIPNFSYFLSFLWLLMPAIPTQIMASIIFFFSICC